MAFCRPIACCTSLQVVLAAAAYAQERTLPPPPAGVQTSREYGIEFAHITPTGPGGNHAGYSVPPELNPFGDDPRYFNRPVGNVPYEYRIGRTEITTGQYLDFVNLAWQLNPQNRYDFEPAFWGARLVQDSPTSMRWELDPGIPNAADVPVWGVGWRQAAYFCNFLQNGRQNSVATLLNGAYDTSTFGQTADGRFTDQVTHNPGARFWIPTIDEWVQAGFWDPGLNSGAGGYWQYGISSNTAPVYGPPTMPGAQANSGWTPGNFGEFFVPVGSYSAMSPWGLMDVAGGVSEWTEGISPFADRNWRWGMGSYAGVTTADAAGLDILGRVLLIPPDTALGGFRIASAVPSPAGAAILLLVGSRLFFRRRS